MLTYEALADTGRAITPNEIARDTHVVAELLDYLRWLADQDTSFPLTAGHVWALYHEGVRKCIPWYAVCEDIGLPVRED